MDAVKFLKEKKRMCELYDECQPCPVCAKRSEPQYESYSCDQFVNCFPEKAIKIVEKWSKEHPIMTNEMKFKEVFGDCPRIIVSCEHLYPGWLDAEYKEPKGEE